MIADAAAFLRAIVAAPDDDLPRLLFADWLDEHGEPARAEFIRVQCELAKDVGPCQRPLREPPCLRGEVENSPISDSRDPCAACAKWRTLWRREREVLFDHGFDWGQQAIPAESDEYLSRGDDNDFHIWSEQRNRRDIRYSFRRGFPTVLTISWADWQANSQALLDSCPIRRRDAAPRRPCSGCEVTRQVAAALRWSGPVKCVHCNGEGTLPAETPDWRGDGVVRLTTWPDVSTDARFPERHSEEWTLRYLGTMYKGVRFELTRAATLAEFATITGSRLLQHVTDQYERSPTRTGPRGQINTVTGQIRHVNFGRP